MDESYSTWIANLTAGREDAATQAARARFRALQARKTVNPPATQAVTVDTTGANVWGSETGHGDDALTHFTLLAGPGRWANCAGR